MHGSDLEESESQGLPAWRRHVGDPVLESNITSRVDFARLMVAALENDELVHQALAIAGCMTPSALAPLPDELQGRQYDVARDARSLSTPCYESSLVAEAYRLIQCRSRNQVRLGQSGDFGTGSRLVANEPAAWSRTGAWVTKGQPGRANQRRKARPMKTRPRSRAVERRGALRGRR